MKTFIVDKTSNKWDNIKEGSVSKVVTENEGFITFRNNNAQFITGTQTFYNTHTPVINYIKHRLQDNNFEKIFDIFQSLNVADTSLMMGTYASIKTHQRAGGDFQSTQNSLAQIRCWINDILRGFDLKL